MEVGPLGTAFIDAHFTTFHEKEAEGSIIPSPIRVNHSKKTFLVAQTKAHASIWASVAESPLFLQHCGTHNHSRQQCLVGSTGFRLLHT